MKLKTVSGIMLMLLLIGTLSLAFNIQPVRSDWTWTETIYIRPDGSVDPDTAPISSVDNITYTFTDNIVGDVPELLNAIVVERDDIVVDGAGYILQGMRAWASIGIYWKYRSNITIENMEIKDFDSGIMLGYSSNNTISRNNISANTFEGIALYVSDYNVISENNLTSNDYAGIELSYSSSNTIFENKIKDTSHYGILLTLYSLNNTLYHNDVKNCTHAVGLPGYYDCPNFWDNGYPSGGNYWSHYTDQDLYKGSDQDELGSDGIWDNPYVMDGNNTDNYPLTKPYSGPHDIGIINVTTSKTIVCESYSLQINITIINYGISTENFNITAYANTTEIETMETTLTSRNSTTFIFAWNTTSWAKGNYTISANATTVSGETDTADNICIDGTVRVNMVGDVAPEYGLVDIVDIVYVAIHFGADKGQPEYEPNADMNGDGIIDMVDIVIIAIHFGETW